MLSVDVDLRPAMRQVQSLEAALARQKPRLLVDIGRQLVTKVHRDFLAKSRGGTGEDGIRWAPLSTREQRRKQRRGQNRIGIRSGELGRLSNIKALTGGRTAYGKPVRRDEVVIDFADQPTANFFNAQRKLLPSQLPPGWLQQAERTAAEHLDRLT